MVAPPDYMGLPLLVRVFGSQRSGDDLVDEVVAVAGSWGKHVLSWRVSDGTVRPTSSGSCSGAAVWSTSTSIVMALPIADGLPDFGVPPDVVVREVTDEATLRDAYVVSGDAFGGERVTDERIDDDLEELRTGLPEGPVGRVVAYVDGRPAGTAGWTLAGRVCRLWGGATHTSLRGRGAYRAVLAERLLMARAAGATLGLSLGRVETSAPILQGLGFTRYGEEREVLLDVSRG